MSVTSVPLVLPISVYGGYFGAGAGTLLLGVLMIATEGDYRRANVGEEPRFEPQHRCGGGLVHLERRG